MAHLHCQLAFAVVGQPLHPTNCSVRHHDSSMPTAAHLAIAHIHADNRGSTILRGTPQNSTHVGPRLSGRTVWPPHASCLSHVSIPCSCTSARCTSACRTCSRQSVKPPVDSPESRAVLPRTSMPQCSSAASSFRPARHTYLGCGVRKRQGQLSSAGGSRAAEAGRRQQRLRPFADQQAHAGQQQGQQDRCPAQASLLPSSSIFQPAQR